MLLVAIFRKGNQWRLSVNGAESPAFEGMLQDRNYDFDSSGAVHVLGIKGGEYVLVEAQLSAK